MVGISDRLFVVIYNKANTDRGISVALFLKASKAIGQTSQI
ncbi:MAG: hypothetical protein ACHBN1_05360 [Heteroscytonema crispum UTEX LB 1556]